MAGKDRILSRTVAAVSYDSRLLPLLEKQGHWGKVQSWFQRTVNIILPSGELITLVRKDQLNGPGFVCLDLWPGLVFGELRMRVGAAVYFISPAGTSRGDPPARLIVDLRTARPWSPPPFVRPPSPRSALKKVISTFSRNYSP
ncbi:MAG: hypothetical protein NTV79_03800, partial [Candidatus Aureabacteria bacterium]|nr:hypothetical protein [Candidatus Auribacterota bacterium]